ncbi:hypothetical protein [Streptomyces sp. Inha503]|uniref:hypothetical protein n=1 Tax=Streptomyces sp. Inha503 TaxID=3383314 RepID=UPI0039A387BE
MSDWTAFASLSPPLPRRPRTSSRYGGSVAHFDQTFPRPGNIGRKFSDPRFQVEVAHDGETLVRAPLLFREYWRNPKETDAVLRDGWFRTGDLIERTAHGEIRLIGRKKDVIITSGGKTTTQ